MAVSAAMSGLALASVPFWEDSCNGSAPFLQKQDLPAEIKMKFQPHEILESGFLSKENFQVVPYDIDTLLLNASNVDQSFGLAKFVSEHNKIRLNYLKADTLEADSATKVKIVNKQKKYSTPQSVVFRLLHEARHYYNHLRGVKSYGVSAEQFAKLCIHDELSAQLTVLIDQRNNYLQTKNLNAFEDNFKFYRNAVASKKIAPSPYKISDEEIFLMGKGITEWWMKNFPERYSNAHSLIVKNWLKAGFFMNKRPNNKRYRQKLDVCYSFVINGQQVNFREAIPDVDIHEKVKKTIDAYYAQGKLERLKGWNERREYFNRNKRGIEELERKAPKQAMTVPSYNPPNNKTSPAEKPNIRKAWLTRWNKGR